MWFWMKNVDGIVQSRLMFAPLVFAAFSFWIFILSSLSSLSFDSPSLDSLIRFSFTRFSFIRLTISDSVTIRLIIYHSQCALFSLHSSLSLSLLVTLSLSVIYLSLSLSFIYRSSNSSLQSPDNAMMTIICSERWTRFLRWIPLMMWNISVLMLGKYILEI